MENREAAQGVTSTESTMVQSSLFSLDLWSLDDMLRRNIEAILEALQCAAMLVQPVMVVPGSSVPLMQLVDKLSERMDGDIMSWPQRPGYCRSMVSVAAPFHRPQVI
jgi:hypothetical protein